MSRAYLKPAEAAEHLRLPSVGALYVLLHRRRKAGKPITTYRLNGRLRFTVADLDAAFTVEEAESHPFAVGRERSRSRRVANHG